LFTGQHDQRDLWSRAISVAIAVGGLPLAYNVTVTLIGLTNVIPTNLDVLLVGPNTTQQVMLMSDAGPSTAINDVNFRLVFDDAGPNLPSDEIQSDTPYHPVNNSSGAINGMPSGPYVARLSAFAGLTADPNGTWNLYVRDRVLGDNGGLSGGWTLNIAPYPILVVNTTPLPITFSNNITSNLVFTVTDYVVGGANVDVNITSRRIPACRRLTKAS
jgi:hypothetical protein